LIHRESGEAVVVAGKSSKRPLLAATSVALLALALLIGGIAIERAGDSTEAGQPGRLVRPRGNTSLAQARAFRGYPLYFAGQTVAGHKLEAVVRIDRTSPAPHTEFSFVYGACRSIRGQACAPPLTILLWPACYRYETRYSIPTRDRTVVRGVRGRSSREFHRLELYPAGTTIVINGGGLKSRADVLRVARRLRGVNVPLRAADRLPARPPHAGQRIRCRSIS
jgi:hypothetical protein